MRSKGYLRAVPQPQRRQTIEEIVVAGRAGIVRVVPQPGIAWRLLFTATAILMGLLLGGGLVWWAEKISNIIAAHYRSS